MRRYKSIKEDRSIPVDGVSTQDVEKDIQELQSYIASLKAAEEVASPSQTVKTQSYASENFGTLRIADPLLDFPPAYDQADDIKEKLTQDYIKDLASLSPEEVLESRALNAKQIERQKQVALLPDRTRQFGFRLLPDTSDTFDYPEHIVARSDNIMRYHSSKNFVDPASIKQGQISFLRRHRYKHMNVQHEPDLELSTAKSVTVARQLTTEKIGNHTENPTLNMLQRHGSSLKSGNTGPRKIHNSKIAGLSAGSDEEEQAKNGDKHHTTWMKDAEAINNSDKQMAISRHRNKLSSLAKPTHKTDIVDDTEAIVTDGTLKPIHLVNVEKRRGNNRAKYAKKKTNYRRPPPPPRRPEPKPEPTTPTTTTTPTTVTTLNSTWTTEGRNMQEIVDSGSDKIDIPLSGAPSGQTIIHGHRDIVFAGAIMGGIGLLLIILSCIYMLISKRRSQKKASGDATTDNKKNYRQLGSAEETAKLTGSQRSLFPLSSDEDTSGGESEEGSRHYQTGTKGTAH